MFLFATASRPVLKTAQPSVALVKLTLALSPKGEFICGVTRLCVRMGSVLNSFVGIIYCWNQVLAAMQ